MKNIIHRAGFLFTPFFFILCIAVTGRVEAQCTQSSLATSYTYNNGSRGAMFNITAGANAVTITGFDANLYGGTTARYEIYYKAGTYVGSETNAAAWTLAGGIDNLASLGNNVATPIPIPLSVTIPAGTTYGFYITNTASGGLNYTSSAVTNVTLATNSDLTIIGGVGKAYPFSSTYSYRLINCTVRYYTGTVTESSTLATSNAASVTTIQNGSGSTLYSSACDALIAKVTGIGASPASGATVARVWIDAVQASKYVKRHYQITPAANGSGRVTLYFSDADFNAFNTQVPAPMLLLPVSTSPGTIADRKANLLIERRPGSSSNNTGNPDTYVGSAQTIDPDDANIVWNSTANRWEITFDVPSFSGFFVKNSAFTLPLKLVGFSGNRSGNLVILSWTTADEVNTKSFEVEKSTDGISFTSIGTVMANGGDRNTYSFNDPLGAGAKVFYRLRMIDVDGKNTYSSIVRITGAGTEGPTLTVYPNPVRGSLVTINSNAPSGSIARLTDINGTTIKQITIRNSSETTDIGQLVPGVYLVHLNGLVQKLVKN